MRALVVFESLYGNTAAVGEVVAGSLRSRGYDVAVGSVSTCRRRRPTRSTSWS